VTQHWPDSRDNYLRLKQVEKAWHQIPGVALASDSAFSARPTLVPKVKLEHPLGKRLLLPSHTLLAHRLNRAQQTKRLGDLNAGILYYPCSADHAVDETQAVAKCNGLEIIW